MHGKNVENSHGTDNSTFKFIEISSKKYEKNDKLGFGILFDEKGLTDKPEKEDEEFDYVDETPVIKTNNYTDNTLISRSILEYWTDVKNSEFFKSRDIIDEWLLTKCIYFKEKYSGDANKTNIKNRIEQNNAHVVSLLERLRYLTLLDVRLVESKNHEITCEYRFTELGKLVAMILKSAENLENYTFVSQTFEQIVKYYSTIKDSYTSFCMLFIKNCFIKDKRLINHIIVSNFLLLLTISPNDKEATIGFIKKIPVLYNSLALHNILINSLNQFREASPDCYQKLIYRLKLAIEEIQEKRCKNLRNFEKLRFSNDGLHSVVVEGHCNVCDRYIPRQLTSMFSLYKYIVKYKEITVKLDCPNCSTKNSLQIYDPFSVNTYQRVFFLSEIFAQDSKGNTTVLSSYYQRIIQYFLVDTNSYIKVREVANCVIKNVDLRIKKGNAIDKTQNKNEIVEDREKTFRKYFNHLVSLKILTERPTKMEKGNGYTLEFKLTKLGNLVALIINTEFTADKGASYDMLYSHLESHFDDQPSTIDVFCKIYLKKCKDNGFFEIFVDSLRRNLLHLTKYVESENDIFTQMILLRTNNKRINKKLWSLWKQSFDELDQNIQFFLMKHLKLVIDRIISESMENFSFYEDASFKCKDIFYVVIVEYRCLKCGKFCALKSITILKYLNKLFNGVKTEKLRSSDNTYVCSQCKFKFMRFSII
ncbi:hypothetical protein BH23THE1_BH23THE1_13580 [soil metagenome]